MDVIVGAAGDSVQEDPKQEEVKAIELTQEELDAAIFEGKKKKFFHERNKDKWPADPYEGDKGPMMGQSF
jgi:hypothetical protein